MKKLIFLLMTGVCPMATAQKSDKTDQPQKPVYDQTYAHKLGADAYGMKNYVMVILKTGDKEITDQDARTEIFAGHMKNIQRMAAEGKLAVAGPFGNNEKEYRGMYVFNVATIDEAKTLTETDPAIKSGMMKAEYYPWYGSAAIQEVNAIHPKIAKKQF